MTSRLLTGNEPFYLQIAERLRAVVAGLQAGEKIPSEPQLAADFGVSRFTVAKAVEQLVRDGLILRKQGSGTFVAEAPLRRQPGYLLSFTEAVEAAGHAATHRVLAFEPTAWSPGLPYDAGTKLMRLDRLRYVDGAAVARHTSILSAALVQRVGLTRGVADDPGFSLYRHFGDRGLTVANAQERLVACLASAEDRRLLELPRNAVVVAVSRHTFAADGTLLDAVNAIYDARRYSYAARLERQHEPKSHKTTGETANDDAANEMDRHDGPRLGPWGDRGTGR